MTLTLELPDALQHRLLTKAAKLGLSLDRYIIQDLDDRNQPAASRPLSESELLTKIKPDLGIEAEAWSRYDHLMALLRHGQLSEQEHTELMALIDRVEVANAERLGYLFELSKFRKVPIQQVMSDLGIRPRPAHDD